MDFSFNVTQVFLLLVYGISALPDSVRSTSLPSVTPIGVVHRNCLQNEQTQTDPQVEEDMSEKELNPDHYPAQRAATVAQHYINTLHGSPFKWFAVGVVQSATVEEIAERGAKYRVAFTVVEVVGNQPAGTCSAEVLFPHGASQAPPEVQLTCGEMLKIDTTAKEQAFYLKLRNNSSLLSAQDIPDSYGNVAPEMEPLWHLGRVASSFVMLKESNENTLYSMAQVASVTQQVSEGEQLLFSYHVLLHDRVSEEILRWKIFVSWCPAEGVRVLQMAAQTP